MTNMTTHARRFPGGARGTAGAVIAGVILILLPLCTQASVRPYTVRWHPSPSGDVAGYRLAVGEASGQYQREIELGHPAVSDGVMQAQIQLEGSGDRYLALRAYDRDGFVSIFSNEIVVPSEGGSNPGNGSDPGSSLPSMGFDVVGLIGASTGDVFGLGVDGSWRLITEIDPALGTRLRTAWCDLDGNGELDLVLGFGPGGQGTVVASLMEGGTVVAQHSIDAGWERAPRRQGGLSYAESNGETWPACGDIDGDGRDEVVVGLGPPARYKLHLYDDALASFDELSVSVSGYDPVRFGGDNGPDATAIPALGDVDGDGRDEIVVAGAGDSLGVFAIYDDAESDFAPIRSNLRFPYETGGVVLPIEIAMLASDFDRFLHPAVGDLDGDGLAEIIIGLGEGGQGRLYILDDATTDYQLILQPDSQNGWTALGGWPEYNHTIGKLVPSVWDIDGDGRLELGLGLGVGGEGTIQLLDDFESGLRGYPATGNSLGLIQSPVNMPVYPALAR